MTTRRPAPPLVAMIDVGIRRVQRYAGLTFALFGVQLALSALVGYAATQLLASHFADRPLFDRAVEGDMVALTESMRDAPGVFSSVFWLAVVAIVIYLVWSWFAVGGLLQTFLTRPHGRANVAECFGRGAARHFFRMVRLFAVGLVPWVIVVVVASFGMAAIRDHMLYEQTLGGVIAYAIPRLLPALLLWLFLAAVIDYARIDLVRHSEPGAFRAFGRAVKLVATRWQPLVHKLIYAALFAGLSLAYLWLVGDHTLSGTGGALTLLFLRVGVSLCRFVAHLVTAGGQVELSELTVFPPKPRKKRRKRPAETGPQQSAAA